MTDEAGLLREALEAIRDYEPVEVMKDEFAYDRMVESYRNAARAALAVAQVPAPAKCDELWECGGGKHEPGCAAYVDLNALPAQEERLDVERGTCWFCKGRFVVDALVAGYDTFDEQRLACLACNERMSGDWRPA